MFSPHAFAGVQISNLRPNSLDDNTRCYLHCSQINPSAGSGVFSSKEVCCTPGVAFPEGCGNVAPSPQPCWVVDTYSPSRLCRSTNTLCGQGGSSAVRS